jgi:hypothetical protein
MLLTTELVVVYDLVIGVNPGRCEKVNVVEGPMVG